jgi:hypothetical protein
MALRHEFPIRVTEPDVLPRPLGEIYVLTLQRGMCRHALYAPALSMLSALGRQSSTGCLLMVFDDRLLIAGARKGAKGESFYVPFADVIHIEFGMILLYSWMKLVFGRNDYKTVTIPFNTVGIEEFRTAFNLIRRALDTAPFASEASRPDTAELPLKFQNALSRWMSGEETLIELAFQPEVRTSWHGLLSLFERQIAPPLLAALTTHQLMLITEEPSQFGVGRKREGQYGHIYTYCPLSRIGALEIGARPSKPGLNEMRLTLVNDRARLLISKHINAETTPRFEWLGRCMVA